jgi:hypothetical protein
VRKDMSYTCTNKKNGEKFPRLVEKLPNIAKNPDK